jgi:hypothetical protein
MPCPRRRPACTRRGVQLRGWHEGEVRCGVMGAGCGVAQQFEQTARTGQRPCTAALQSSIEAQFRRNLIPLLFTEVLRSPPSEVLVRKA